MTRSRPHGWHPGFLMLGIVCLLALAALIVWMVVLVQNGEQRRYGYLPVFTAAAALLWGARRAFQAAHRS